jgi:hypothetical protein
MSGDIDVLYVRARRVLLDALEALRDQLDAVILVGAQAIYLHTGEADLAVAPFTSDADLALDPAALRPDPKLGEAMEEAGFQARAGQPGSWISEREGIAVDLMVPQRVGGPGRRGARLGVHGNQAARKAAGLEAALVDKRAMTIGALEDGDARSFVVAVAGPAALLIAKLYKLKDRREDEGRRSDKDALDVYRLLRATEAADLAPVLDALRRDPRADEIARGALEYLDALFGTTMAPGARMAARAAQPLLDFDEVTASCAALAQELLAQLRQYE